MERNPPRKEDMVAGCPSEKGEASDETLGEDDL